jgi:hypothetical protein
MNSENLEKWRDIEFAKHRLVYQLLRYRLPVVSKMDNRSKGLCLDFLAKEDVPAGSKDIKTGHADGVITLLISEADPVVREQIKKQMSERYRTLLGHFRHEVGHYFWDRLVATNQFLLNDFRALFGNEQADYGESLKSYYRNGSPANWQSNFISQYATSHPWEDWAETWAHYLHIMDMTETAYYFGMSVSPILKDKSLRGSVDFDPYQTKDFNTIYKGWAPLSFAINSLNRSMGIPDAYPFIISSAVVDKMKFIHQLIYRL